MNFGKGIRICPINLNRGLGQVTPAPASQLVTAVPVITVTRPNFSALWVADNYNASAGTWADLLHGYVLSTGGASKPTLDATGINSTNAVKFVAASTQWLTNTTDAALYQLADGNDPNISIIVQAKFSGTAVAVVWFFGGSGGASANRMDFSCQGSSTTAQLVEQGASGGSATKVWTVADVTAAAHVYAVVQSGTTQNLYVDNVVNASPGALDVTARTAVRFNVGAFSAGTAPFGGWIRRIGIIPGVASAAELAAIQALWGAT